jgi:hypothetical protein
MNTEAFIKTLANKPPEILAQKRTSAMFLHICLPLLLIIISSLTIVIIEKRHISLQYKVIGVNDVVLMGSNMLDKPTLEKVIVDYAQQSKKTALKTIDKSKQVVTLGLTLELLTTWLGLGILYVGILTKFYLVNYLNTIKPHNNPHYGSKLGS